MRQQVATYVVRCCAQCAVMNVIECRLQAEHKTQNDGTENGRKKKDSTIPIKHISIIRMQNDDLVISFIFVFFCIRLLVPIQWNMVFSRLLGRVPFSPQVFHAFEFVQLCFIRIAHVHVALFTFYMLMLTLLCRLWSLWTHFDIYFFLFFFFSFFQFQLSSSDEHVFHSSTEKKKNQIQLTTYWKSVPDGNPRL